MNVLSFPKAGWANRRPENSPEENSPAVSYTNGSKLSD